MPPAPPSPELPELPELLPLDPAEPLLPRLFAPALDEPELALLPPLELPGVEPLEPLAPLEEVSPPELEPASAVDGEPFDEQPSANRLVPARIAA
jgi:hypothetical protein